MAPRSTPREVVKRELELNAAAVPAPVWCQQTERSRSDHHAATDEGLALVDVRMLDHIVLGADRAVSLAQQAWL
jgi:DNA repair protein RadC